MKRGDNLGICLILMIGYHMVHCIDIFSDQYVGCYEEGWNGGLDHIQEPWPRTDNSINNCVDYCRSQGYAYAGMKRGELCKCGNTYFSTFSYNCWNSERVKCPGNHSEVCGGTGGKKGWRFEGTSTFRVCPAGRYGSSCSDMCPEFCGGKGCRFNGNCLNECPAGKYGTSCSQTCLVGWSGANCKEPCRDCLNNRCHPVNGYCTDGCNTDARRYGPFCRTSHYAGNDNPRGPCPFCGHCKNSICAGGTGYSYNACPNIWQGDACADCDDGRWETRCERSCPNCASGKCSKEDGQCAGKGCNDGFYGSKCSDICPVNCLHKMCVQNGGVCSSYGCKDGFYGSRCDQNCPEKCASNKCTQDNGICTEGCQVGFHGPKCDKACPQHCKSGTCYPDSGNCNDGCNDGFHGLQCNDSCPANCASSKCSLDGDTCTMGCNDGFHGAKCSENCSQNCKDRKCDQYVPDCTDGCIDGYYDNFCNKTCPGHCVSGACSRDDGSCPGECVNGYYGDKCNVTCPENCKPDKCFKNGSCSEGCDDGFYESHCLEQCPTSCASKRCFQTNGTCSVGCTPGSFGDFCNKTCPGICVSVACSRSDGTCSEGCQDGLHGPSCSDKCPVNCAPGICNQTDGSCSAGCVDSFFGYFCNQICPGKCASKGCNKADGSCSGDCVSGYFGDSCNQTCIGKCPQSKCDKRNGFCACSNNCKEECDKTNGFCDKGCLNGTCGTNCRGKCMESNPGEACNQTTCLPESQPLVQPPTKDTAGMVASVVVGSILLLGVIAGITFLAVMYYKRRRPTNKNAGFSNVITNQHIDPPLPLVTTNNNPEKERKPAKPVKPVKPTTADKPTLQTQSQEDVTGKPSMKVKPYVDAPLASSPLVKPSSSNSPHAACSGSIDVTEDDENTYYNVMHLSAKISKDQLKEYIKTSEANGELNKQYLRLKPGKVYPWTVAELEENAPKNRYKGISAYDHSRVVLQRDNPEEGDYINANYMPGYSGEKEFIASQGVTAQNLVDFWRMIWQEKVSTIVMTTKLKEVKMKSLQYWPDDSDPLDYGAINVTVLETSICFQFVIRKLLAKKGASKRILHHLHFVGWPDHGVPDSPISLVNFWHVVHTLPTRQAPVLVHCSAGVGRTGTFIALDYLLEEASATHHVDVLRCVEKLRYNRVDMVQNVNQYIFLHHAVYEGIFIGPTLLSREQLTESDQTDSDAITKQIEALNEMHPYDANASASYEKGNEDSEWSLYVFKVLGRGQNAIEIRNPKGSTIIISMPPEPDVTADFWEMVQRYRTDSIVISKPEVKKSPWLPTCEHNIVLPHGLCVKQQHTGKESTRIIIGTPASIDYYNVTQKTNEEEKGEGDESTYMNITEKTVDVSAGASAGDGDGAKQDVEESTYMNTEEAKQQEGPCVIQLLTLDDMTPANIVNTWQKMQRGKPHISISKHCSGGVFAVSCVLLDMMEVFGQVDVLSTVRQLRPHFIRNEVEYKMLHRVLHLYCQQQSTQ